MTVLPDASMLCAEVDVCEAAEVSAVDEGLSRSVADKARLRAMVDDYFDQVCVALRRLGVDEAEVEDNAQQVFVIAQSKLRVIERKSERAFLLGTAAKVASHARRSKRRRREVAEGDDSVFDTPDAVLAPDEIVEQKQMRALLDEVLAAMPEELREMLVLFELEELSMQEISLALDLKMGTVASRLRRAREKFAEISEQVVKSRGGLR
jgi:RNA polymerase sigma-70 factor (ECF subfamily)